MTRHEIPGNTVQEPVVPKFLSVAHDAPLAFFVPPQSPRIMKLISTAASLLLSSCCAFHHCPESAATAATPTATTVTSDEVAYKVIPLRFAAAGDMASVLRNSVTKQSGHRPPQIIADDRTNRVVVSCAPEQLASIEKLIAELDVEVKK